MAITLVKEGFLLLSENGEFVFTSDIYIEGLNLSFEQIKGFKTLSSGISENGIYYKEVRLEFSLDELQIFEVKPFDARPWPFNGYVLNNSNQDVTVWSDTKNLYKIAARSTSDRFTEDVDHIQDRNGQWYKIGTYTVTVDENGTITDWQCKVSNFGQDCP